MSQSSPFRRLFTDHPASVGESYLEHAGVASSFGARMIVGGVACMFHGLVPAWFTRTGSNTVKALYREMISRQPTSRKPAFDEPEWQLEYEI